MQTGQERCVVGLRLSEQSGAPLRATLQGDLGADGTLELFGVIAGLKAGGRGTIRAGQLDLTVWHEPSAAMKALAGPGTYRREYHLRGAKLSVPRAR